MRRERLYLEDIVAASDEIAEFIRGEDYASFEANAVLRSAIVAKLTIIGEAVACLPEELRQRHAGIPWAGIKAFRNVIVHKYFGIDWEEVWRTAAVRVPELRAQVAEILRKEFPQ